MRLSNLSCICVLNSSRYTAFHDLMTTALSLEAELPFTKVSEREIKLILLSFFLNQGQDLFCFGICGSSSYFQLYISKCLAKS